MKRWKVYERVVGYFQVKANTVHRQYDRFKEWLRHYSRLAAECLPHVLFCSGATIAMYFLPGGFMDDDNEMEVLIDIISVYIPGMLAFSALQTGNVRQL